MFITKDQILEAIAAMSVTDIIELVSAIEKKFGVSANNVTINSNSNSTLKVEEQTEFKVILKDIGQNKISVIKAVRSVVGLGLKESKDLVESTPTILKEKVNKETAETIKKSLEESGAVVSIE